MGDDRPQPRGLQVVLGGVFVLAVAVFFLGIGEPDLTDGLHQPSAQSAPVRVAIDAPTYGEMFQLQVPDPPLSLLDRAPRETPAAGDSPPDQVGGIDVEVARAERALRRAFDGAPPTIPHPTRETTLVCVDCHLEGLQLGDLRAPVMSHQALTSCTQCHVRAEIDRPWSETEMLALSRFEGGRSAVERGDIQEPPWPTAPPVIPHTTWMRSNCTSCHGSLGIVALQTTHPERTSCTQCHVPSAWLDQRVASVRPFPPQPTPVTSAVEGDGLGVEGPADQ